MECNNPRADINRDGIVNIDDELLLGAAYGSHPGDANWNPDADINQDGVVDSKDLGIIGANFGCTFEHTPPAQGRLESLTYPSLVDHGANVRVGFKIHNTGGSTGTFIARLYQGSTKVGGDWRAVVHAGDSPSGAITATAPATGTSVTYTLKLFLET